MVTNETALRLKAANFPQPAFAPLQWWYSPAAELLLACSFDKNPAAQSPYRFIDPSNPDYPDCWANLKSFCYAPTAAEILPLLPSEYCIELVFEGGFAVFRHTWDDTAPAESTHESMDEALALAWLKINEEK